MLILTLLTFGIFFLLWLGDFYLTIKVVKTAGTQIEMNPIIRKLFNFRRRYIILFKTIEIGFFLYLIYFLTGIGNIIPFFILLIYILFYAVLVTNNSRVYYQANKKENTAFKYVFLGLIFFLILFIYLNYLFYSDILIAYNTLSSCQTSYTDLYSLCKKSNITSNISASDYLTELAKTIRIPLPRP